MVKIFYSELYPWFVKKTNIFGEIKKLFYFCSHHCGQLSLKDFCNIFFTKANHLSRKVSYMCWVLENFAKFHLLCISVVFHIRKLLAISHVVWICCTVFFFSFPLDVHEIFRFQEICGQFILCFFVFVCALYQLFFHVKWIWLIFRFRVQGFLYKKNIYLSVFFKRYFFLFLRVYY